MRKAVAMILVLLAVVGLLSACGSVTTSHDDVIRLHILANSDSDDDQSMKLWIRDYVLAQWGSQLSQETAADTAWKDLKALTPDIEKELTKQLEEQGADYGATADIGIVDFPDRDYDGVVFPAGKYRALEIKLGKGKGHNWWCVLFPPLCLTSETGEMDLQEYKELVKQLDEAGVLDSEDAPEAPVRSWLYDKLKGETDWNVRFAHWTKQYWLSGEGS